MGGGAKGYGPRPVGLLAHQRDLLTYTVTMAAPRSQLPGFRRRKSLCLPISTSRAHVSTTCAYEQRLLLSLLIAAACLTSGGMSQLSLPMSVERWDFHERVTLACDPFTMPGHDIVWLCELTMTTFAFVRRLAMQLRPHPSTA